MKKLLSAVCGLLIWAAVTPAATISYTASGSTAVTPDDFILSLQQFDSSLGTLTGITIDYNVLVSGDFEVRNGNPKADGTLTGSLFSDFALVGPGGLGTISNLSPSTSLGTHTIAKGSTYFFSVLGAGASDTYTVSLADFGLFTGNGTVDFTNFFSSFTSPNMNFSPNVFLQDLLGKADLKITYQYDATETPEPATFAVAGVGLAVLAIQARRRRSC